MVREKEDVQSDLKRSTLRLLAGMLIAFGATFILLLAFTAILYFGSVSEKWIVPSATALALLSVFFGARFSAMHISERHFLQGALVGVLYYGIVYICALSAVPEFNFSVRTALLLLIGALVGGLGGMTMQNKTEKKSRKRKKKR